MSGWMVTQYTQGVDPPTQLAQHGSEGEARIDMHRRADTWAKEGEKRTVSTTATGFSAILYENVHVMYVLMMEKIS